MLNHIMREQFENYVTTIGDGLDEKLLDEENIAVRQYVLKFIHDTVESARLAARSLFGKTVPSGIVLDICWLILNEERYIRKNGEGKKILAFKRKSILTRGLEHKYRKTLAEADKEPDQDKREIRKEELISEWSDELDRLNSIYGHGE